MALHLAARVIGVADPGEVLGLDTRRELVIGSGLEFEETGRCELEGIESLDALHPAGMRTGMVAGFAAQLPG